MFGHNPKRSLRHTPIDSYDVVSIFKTIQGEGPLAGHPSIFLRLGGCNLACDFCDTEFENFQRQTLISILGQIKSLAANTIKWVIITGGEPLRQPIEALCQALMEEGFKIQIETNGTVFRPLPKEVMVICSPKNQSGKYYRIREDLLAVIDAFKFIISNDKASYRDVVDVGQSLYHTPVYVQPMDEYDPIKNAKNQQRALELALKNGYILSLQTHKILNIP